jgi:hypothetical protein
MMTRVAAVAFAAVAVAGCSSSVARKTSAHPSFKNCVEAWNAPGNDVRRQRVAHVIVPAGYTRAAIMLSETIGGMMVQNSSPNPTGCDVIFYKQRRWVSYAARRDRDEFRFPANLPDGRDSDRSGIWSKFVQRGPNNATITDSGKLLLHHGWEAR